MSPRALVTGAAGFLGSHLCDRLLALGCDVLGVDNFFSGSRDNVVHLSDHPRFELMRHDVTFPLYVEVDQIFNLACPASPLHYQRDPVQTTKTSVVGAVNMLGLAKRLKAPILQASTSEVYGDPLVHPQPESYCGKRQPDRPARLLRRRQALRRDPVLRLPPPARHARQGRPHLQHLRPAPPAVQRLMEKSGLVIVDFDSAIKHGFVALTQRLGDIVARGGAVAGGSEDDIPR